MTWLGIGGRDHTWPHGRGHHGREHHWGRRRVSGKRAWRRRSSCHTSLPLWAPPIGLGSQPDRLGEDVHSACGTGLLALEPRAQAGRVEDMVAGQLLAVSNHLLSTDDADVVSRLQLFRSGIWVPVGREGGRDGGREGGRDKVVV